MCLMKCLLLLAIACQNMPFSCSEIELGWKKDWARIFFRTYRIYKENDLLSCKDGDRDVRFDIERKINAINDIPIGNVIYSLKQYIKKK